MKKADPSGILSTSRRFRHPSRENETAGHHNSHLRKNHAVGGGKGNQADQELNNTPSPTSLNHNLEEQGWSNNGNGVFIHDGGVPCPDSSNSWSPSRKGLHRRVKTNPSWSEDHSLSPTNRIDLQVPPGSSHSPPKADCHRKLSGSFYTLSKPYATLATLKRRKILMTMSLGIAFLGYVVVTLPNMNESFLTGTLTKGWLMNLPHSFSASILGGDVGIFNIGHEPAEANPHRTIISMEEERKHVQSLSRSRMERRRARTKPPSTYPTISAATAAAGGADDKASPPSLSSPRLTLNLPAHRELEDNGLVNRRELQAIDGNSNEIGNVRRQLQQKSQHTPICGIMAGEASQLNPNHYPPSAHIGPKSRVVVTGALSQLGMELILQLFENCGVEFIVGIDSAHPNTRHERIEMIESRYGYIQRRVPGFQRLMIPVFGIHPHPKLGDEASFDDDHGFDLIKRLTPTHIVHLAGMEEGHGEYADYGDTNGASPFAEGGKSSMMRRFESLLSMDQVFSSVARWCTTSQPQVVYISSNEAAEKSGVSFHSTGNASAVGPNSASVYGTISLLKEVIASYYHRHHGIDSVGIRVPTIIGTFSRPGSLMNDLSVRAIRNAVGGDVEGVPKMHLDRDRYELPSIVARREGADLGAREQLVFVYDVASAVLTAMQFKKDYNIPFIDPNGPTLFNIGSKMTGSMNELKEMLESHLPPRYHSEGTWPIANNSLAPVVHSSGLSIHDSERNLNLLGWVHQTLLHDGTKTMLAWQAMKMYPFGIPPSNPSFPQLHGIIKDSLPSLAYHALPCAVGCRWHGAAFCTSTPWDAVIETTKQITETCQYVIYTVDLRTELASIRRQSAPSQRKGWEKSFCKIAFVSTSSKLAKGVYEGKLNMNTPMIEWNGSRKAGHWIIVTVAGTQKSMPEYERSLAKLNPTHFFHDGVQKAMYINHERIILTTDQAMGVMYHMDLPARNNPEKKTIFDEKMKENKDIWLPPQPQRHSVFFTNEIRQKGDSDTSSVKNLARFVMRASGIAETKDIRAQVAFYEEAIRNTRSNTLRSPNYQDFHQVNLIPFDFLRTSWVVHELKSEFGHNLRCEMYEEHSLWGNRDMEDLSISFVLAKNKVKMRLGKIVENRFADHEEWYPLLIPREPNDEDAITEGPMYLDYLEDAQKFATDSRGHEIFISFLNQKSK